MNNVLGIHCHNFRHLTERIIKLGFSRGEFYNFAPEQLPVVKRFIEDNDVAASVHCPLRKAPWYPYPITWSFLSTGTQYEDRALSFKLIEESLCDSKELGAEYVVIHYPTPATEQANQIPFEAQYDFAWESAQRLQKLSESFELSIHIEGFGPSPFMNADFLISVLETFPALRYCFDTGHIALMSQRDGLDYFGFLAQLIPYIGSVHVWDTRGWDDYKMYHHLPPHPGLKPSDGWVDIERVVTMVSRDNPDAVFMLEYSSRLPEEFGLDECQGIEWFKNLVASARPAGSVETSPLPTLCQDNNDKHTQNIVLAGFMGAGKTKVGRMVAARLKRPFVDMDDMLEGRFGMNIPAFFEEHGEAAFREQETQLAEELAREKSLVISTGGGALVSPANRETFARDGFVICLQCEADEIIRRIGHDPNRPMLKGDDLRARVEALLEKRRPAYLAIPYQVDTTHLTTEQVADEVIALWQRSFSLEGRRLG